MNVITVKNWPINAAMCGGTNLGKVSFIISIFCALLLTTSISAGRDVPLANEGLRGIYAKSLDQVLVLPPEQVDLATAALIASEYWSDAVPGLRHLDLLDDMAYEIRKRVVARRLSMNHRAIPVINEYLFRDLGFVALEKVSDPNDLFLHRVLDRKRGYCLSLSILYLALGERLGLALYGVVVPGHFFVRYDDGNIRFNIETTSNGGNAPDEHYLKKFKVPDQYHDGIYMKNLNKIQTIGCLFNNLGNSYSAINDIETAISTLEKAVQINPSLAESRMNLGNLYLQKGWTNDAVNQYQIALRINPSDAKANLNLGNAYLKMEWLVQAISQYNRSIGLDPTLVQGYRNLAMVYVKQEKFPNAIAQLKQAIKLDPKDALTYCQLGDIYGQMEDCQKALVQYQKALKLKRNLVQAYYGMGLCYNKTGRTDEEIKAYKRVLSVDPQMYGALVNLGNVYFEKEDFQSAIEHYIIAARVNNEEPSIFHNLGSAYANSGQYAQAIIEFRKALALNPDLGETHSGMAMASYKLKKYKQALEHITAAEQLGSEIDRNLLDAIKRKLP